MHLSEPVDTWQRFTRRWKAVAPAFPMAASAKQPGTQMDVPT